MKKFIVFLSAFCFAASFAFSQKAKVPEAYNYYKEPYQQYDKAKAAIDEATVNEATKGLDQTWYYRGIIYSALYKNETFGNLCVNCLQTAYEAFNKSLEINPKNEWADEIKLVRIPWVMNQIFSEGVEYFKTKKY